MRLYKEMIQDHIQENMTVYLFITTLLLTGIIFGAIIVNSMNFLQKQELYFHVEQFLQQLNMKEAAMNKDVLQKSFYFHLKYLSLLFFLGLTVIGIPLIWILVFLKGIVIGFSVGFIVNQLGIKGFLIALISIAPQNMIIIPVYIVAGSLAMLFSLILLQKLFTKKRSTTMIRPFFQYVSAFIILVVISFAGSFIETFLSHEAIKIFITRFVS